MTRIARTDTERLALILETLTGSAPAHGLGAEQLIGALAVDVAPSREGAYLVLAVLGSAIPDADAVVEAHRLWQVEGIRAVIAGQRTAVRVRPRPPVRVTSGIVVDVTDTGRTPFTTGIQRVARESIARWPLERIELVSWDARAPRIHDSTVDERTLVLGPVAAPAGHDGKVSVVPFRGTYVLPEIAVARARFAGIRSIARHAGGRAVAIGFDCISVTTGEISPPGMPAAFAGYLSALAGFDDVVAISGAAAAEFEGWRGMLGGAGLEGPEIGVAELPFSVGSVEPPVVERVRRELSLADGRPVVVAVGSHEPRKNHVAFLHACELLWREGAEFDVVMAGGNSWDTELYDEFLDELLSRGRPIKKISRAADETIWALYRIARFSVFCSLNEGFGLPVAESLASGTPVVTSGFGSMRQLAQGHGGAFADPRDPRSIADAMRTLLDDDAAIERLRRESASLPRSSWDGYAAAVWAVVEAGTR